MIGLAEVQGYDSFLVARPWLYDDPHLACHDVYFRSYRRCWEGYHSGQALVLVAWFLSRGGVKLAYWHELEREEA